MISKVGKILIKEFKFGKEIGRGSTCTVFKATRNGVEYAVKTFNFYQIARREQEPVSDEKAFDILVDSFINESLILSMESLRKDPYVVKLFFALRDTRNLYLVLPHYRLTVKSLFGKCRLGMKGREWIAVELIRGLNSLRNNLIVHRDMKPENFFVSKDGLIKIGDFGLSKKLSSFDKKMTSRVGSHSYVAPEVLTIELSRMYHMSRGGSRRRPSNIIQYDQRCDLWSLGICLLEILSWGKNIYEENMPNSFDCEDFRKIFKCTQRIPEEIGDFAKKNEFNADAIDLIMNLLKPNPEERIRFVDVLKHPFFRKRSRLDFSSELRKLDREEEEKEEVERRNQAFMMRDRFRGRRRRNFRRSVSDFQAQGTKKEFKEFIDEEEL